ncbi:Uncharacterised protein [Mycobacteroides abscessus subsp. abscessus]|nr:Uncharacterised protein [Mycobacteroides abscessus subsp. abscessus]
MGGLNRRKKLATQPRRGNHLHAVLDDLFHHTMLPYSGIGARQRPELAGAGDTP